MPRQAPNGAEMELKMEPVGVENAGWKLIPENEAEISKKRHVSNLKNQVLAWRVLQKSVNPELRNNVQNNSKMVPNMMTFVA